MAEARGPTKPRTKATKKAAPRTKGTPAKPPQPRKVAAPAKPAVPVKPPARLPPPTDARPPTSPPRIIAPRPPAEPVWVPIEPVWEPAPPTGGALIRRRVEPTFDPATGEWLLAEPTPSALDPAAYRKGATRSIVLNVLFGITLGLLALNFIAGLVIGLVLVFAPDSELAQQFDGPSGIDSPLELAVLSLIMFVLVGVIPFFWVLGTRTIAWLGTKAYLQLWGRAKDWLLGFVLVPAMFVSVLVLSAAYICATEGCAALTEEANAEEGNGGDAILDNLNWPVAVIVALCAGIGEEILFRGVLQKHLGVWGQAVAFGLAHAGNAYPPQVLFAFGLGLVFGFLFKRGWSLVSLIVAHALYDLTILAIAILFPDWG